MNSFKKLILFRLLIITSNLVKKNWLWHKNWWNWKENTWSWYFHYTWYFCWKIKTSKTKADIDEFAEKTDFAYKLKSLNKKSKFK